MKIKGSWPKKLKLETESTTNAGDMTTEKQKRPIY